MCEKNQNVDTLCKFCQGDVNPSTGVCRYCYNLNKEIARESAEKDMEPSPFFKVDDDDENLGDLKV